MFYCCVCSVNSQCHSVFYFPHPLFSINKKLLVSSFYLIETRGFMSSRGHRINVPLFCLFVFVYSHHTVVVFTTKVALRKRDESNNTEASTDTCSGGHGAAARQLFPVFIRRPAAVMSDRRQRARVQGSWARQVPRSRGRGQAGRYSFTSHSSLFSARRTDNRFLFSGGVSSNHQQAQSSVASISTVWKSGHQRPPETFEFQSPEKVSNQSEGSIEGLSLTD